MAFLRCKNCGKEIKDHAHKSAICTVCGNVMSEIPLTGGDFEKMEEGSIVTPDKKPEKNKDAKKSREVF